MTAKKHQVAFSIREYVHQLHVSCWCKLSVIALLLAPFAMMKSVHASGYVSDTARIEKLEKQLAQLT